MSLNDIVPVQTSSSSGGKGGLWGTLIGTVAPLVAGGIAAPFTGGASMVPALMAAGVGGGLGGVVGNMADPAEASSDSSSNIQQSSVDKQGPIAAMKSDPQVQLASMASAKELLKSAEIPQDQALQYNGLLTDAMGKLKQKMGGFQNG